MAPDDLRLNNYVGPIVFYLYSPEGEYKYLALATPYRLIIEDFPYPLSFSALVWGDPLRTYVKALRFLKLESSRQPMVKIW